MIRVWFGKKERGFSVFFVLVCLLIRSVWCLFFDVGPCCCYDADYAD